jgi:hypothetical protein
MPKYTIAMTLDATPDGLPKQDAGTHVRLTCDYCPGSPAVMYLRNGDPGYPAEPDEGYVTKVEMDAVTLTNDHPLVILIDGWMLEDDSFYERVLLQLHKAHANARAILKA